MTIAWAMAVCVVTAASASAAPAADRCPFAGHNCYSDASVERSERRLLRALAAGLRVIEVDVNHNPKAGGFVVTHKSKDPPVEPSLADFLEPLWRRWRAEPGEHLLIIDLKAGRHGAVARDLRRYLQRYRDALCTFAPDGTPKSTGPISVCLTGSGGLGQAYLGLAAKDGEWLARRDGGASGRDALRRYLGRRPRPGVAYLTLNWLTAVGRIEDMDKTVAWLREIVAGARRHRTPVRLYTLNVYKPKRADGRLVSGAWDRRWTACVRAGVDMIATDNYELAVEWWRQIGSKLTVHGPRTDRRGTTKP